MIKGFIFRIGCQRFEWAYLHTVFWCNSWLIRPDTGDSSAALISTP
jgi:hypothetical protein